VRKQKGRNHKENRVGDGGNIKIEPNENGWEVWDGLIWLVIGNNGELM
jgi:hypothetical protein